MKKQATNSSNWLAYRQPKPEAKHKLFCFPYAGGGASIYRSWQDSSLFPEIEICPVELPGRGQRLSEHASKRLLPLVRSIAEALLPHLDRPFSFFGHSMGAMIAFEMARLLRAEGAPAPRHLFLSACRAPQFAHREPVTYDWPEEAFKQELRRLKGTPEIVLEQAELMQLLLPLLRSDFEVTQTYEYEEAEPLECGITVYGGLEDEEVTRPSLNAWREHTTGPFKMRIFPGDHFFLSTSRSLLLRVLAIELHQLTA